MIGRISQFVRKNGIDIKSRHRRNATDPFEAQRHLLAGRDVKVVIDCGAHHGCYSRRYAGEFPSARVYAFEPTPATFGVLRQNVANYTRIEPIHAAVGMDTGEVDFYVSTESEQSNSLLPFGGGAGQAVRVKCLSLDSFCQERQITHVNCLKLDVEGMEEAVLRGAMNLMGRSAIDMILAEVRADPIRPGATTLMKLGHQLEDQGYHLFGLYDFIWESGLRLDWCDSLWISDPVFQAYQKRVGGVQPNVQVISGSK